MFSVGEHESHDSHYTPNNYLQQPSSTSLTSTANILNYDATSPHHGSSEHNDFMDVKYKMEPSTPTMSSIPHSDYQNSYPTTFTPSPSLSGSESPRTPTSFYQSSYAPPTLEGGERLQVPFPAPTPPLSATHLTKEPHHTIPDPEMKFSTDQIDCICDTLQQRKDMTTLGEETELSFFKDLYCQEAQF